MKITVVTSTSAEGYKVYAAENYKLFKQFWDNRIELHVYSEDQLEPKIDGIYYHNLYEEIPECKHFVNKNKDLNWIPPYKQKPYKFNFIKFCFKVYAICIASRTLDTDILIWLDSDIKTSKSIDQNLLLSYIRNDDAVSYLNRELNEKNSNPKVKLSSETGLLFFNMRNKITSEFFKRYQEIYDSGDIFKLDEVHDAFVLDSLILNMEREGKTGFRKLSNGITERPLEDIFSPALTHHMGSKKWK
jgi:hypothetical protein